ncbi:MAG TPA: alpha-galactosidase, partial [Bacteroidales bacterium]|nr:alpha-galactosidase [Bacteroidales bacterium]
MIRRDNELFVLDTKDSSYCFRIMPSGHLEHLYYGAKIDLSAGFEAIIEKKRFLGGNQIAYSKEYSTVGLEDLCLEMSSFGKGDVREPFIEITYADGSSTCDFLFQETRIASEKPSLKTLPYAYFGQSEDSKSDVDNIYLEIELIDKYYNTRLILTYSVFYESNVITRSAKLINNSNKKIKLDRLMSMQLDLDNDDYKLSTFRGAWAREMNRHDLHLEQGIIINDSKAGTSSNRSNPFFILSDLNSNEEYGDCYGFNLIYSGNHYAAIEVNSMDKLRVVQGIQPSGFQFVLDPNELFEGPEAVITYSNKGFTGMSHNMHHFIRNHIVRGEWKNKLRPILINSWEANYFKFNEDKLVKQAKAAKEAGIELFVLDDGWFGKRNDDTSSLGDWQENKKKLRNGLKGLADRINGLGMDFGIWVEPEMVNEDSDCYRLNPEWAVGIPGRENSLGRNQRILDLTREDVRLYIIEEMTRVFSSANITYVKWDMNRIFSDYYSLSLDLDQQKEFSHRYVMGLYKVMDILVKRFPKILFESCASGGNRFDLGMLCYMPQIWSSDNTDAMSRSIIQSGYSYGYPVSVMGAHVSGCPNHQTLRNVSIDTRFDVAAFGLLGYECNLLELSSDEKKAVTEQIKFYKKYRRTLQFGEFYRIQNKDNKIIKWLNVNQDKSQAIGLFLQKEVTPNYSYGKFKTRGLKENAKYHFTNHQH